MHTGAVLIRRRCWGVHQQGEEEADLDLIREERGARQTWKRHTAGRGWLSCRAADLRRGNPACLAVGVAVLLSRSAGGRWGCCTGGCPRGSRRGAGGVRQSKERWGAVFGCKGLLRNLEGGLLRLLLLPLLRLPGRKEAGRRCFDIKGVAGGEVLLVRISGCCCCRSFVEEVLGGRLGRGLLKRLGLGYDLRVRIR